MTLLSAGLDEVPMAYKDIDEVMAAQQRSRRAAGAVRSAAGQDGAGQRTSGGLKPTQEQVLGDVPLGMEQICLDRRAPATETLGWFFSSRRPRGFSSANPRLRRHNVGRFWLAS